MVCGRPLGGGWQRRGVGERGRRDGKGGREKGEGRRVGRGLEDLPLIRYLTYIRYFRYIRGIGDFN